jgi:hypothetical protein
MPTDEEVDAVVAAIQALGAPETWEQPPAFVGLALAIIEAIWSIGVRYEGVQNVVARYRATRAAEGTNGEDDTPADLVDFIDRLGGPEAFAERMENRQRTSSKSGILKAEAVLREARVLVEEGVQKPSDLHAADADRLDQLSTKWAAITGQGSLISWHYFLMCAGLPGVKPDRMIRRFVADALGRPAADAVGVEEARILVTLAAERMGRDPRVVDFNIWKYQRERGVEECC